MPKIMCDFINYHKLLAVKMNNSPFDYFLKHCRQFLFKKFRQSILKFDAIQYM